VELALPQAGLPARSSELLDVDNRLCGDICRDFATAYMALLSDVFAAADTRGEIQLAAHSLSAVDAAALAHASAVGLVADHVDPATTHRRLDQLVCVLVTGLGGKPNPR
jgi:hypothetical protein